VHASAQFRAIATPSNMPAFTQAFSCKPGDSMVRAPNVQVNIQQATQAAPRRDGARPSPTGIRR